MFLVLFHIKVLMQTKGRLKVINGNHMQIETLFLCEDDRKCPG